MTTLDLAVEALYGYAIVHGRLPCPDAIDSADGMEDRVGEDACAVRDGLLPYAQLGVAGADAWGFRLHYQVSARLPGQQSGSHFASRDDGHCAAADGDLDLCERGDIEILTRGDNGATPLLESKYEFVRANQVPAVVLSHGVNHHGAYGGPLGPGHNGDERENSDGDRRFIARGYAADQPACADDQRESQPLCEFDDLLRWLSPTILNHRLVVGGRLP